MTPERDDPAATAIAGGIGSSNFRQETCIVVAPENATPGEAGAHSPPTPQPGAADVPQIEVRGGEIHDTATQAETALLAADVQFFVRGAGLVRPVVEKAEADKGASTTTARLVAVTPDAMVDHLSRVAAWTRFDGRRSQNVAVDPPRQVAAILLARDGEWRFRPLAGIITTPTLRPDGSVLSKPGYDPATRLLLIDPPQMPRLATKPTREAALKALALLSKLLSEFPFTDGASRSVALSALITPVVRGAMPVAPLHAMRAPTPGSGKSFLVDIASAIATGQRCPVIAAGRTEEENEKRLGAALLAGQPLVSIDNLNGELSGDTLCQIVERPIVEVRPLGRSELVRIESRATVFATGNNLVIAGDMVRRVVMCSLDPKVERPELRRFGGDPFGKVLADRGTYVAAALTVVRAYVVAGCPNQRPALGSFEAWSRLVRSALCWLGCPDPVETMDVARAEDPETGAMREVFAGWQASIRVNNAVSAGEIIAASEHNLPLKEALSVVLGDGQALSARRLGRWLARHKGRIVAGLSVAGSEDTHSKTMRWTLKVAPHA